MDLVKGLDDLLPDRAFRAVDLECGLDLLPECNAPTVYATLESVPVRTTIVCWK